MDIQERIDRIKGYQGAAVKVQAAHILLNSLDDEVDKNKVREVFGLRPSIIATPVPTALSAKMQEIREELDKLPPEQRIAAARGLQL